MIKYFNINYEFNRDTVHGRINECIRQNEADYICVADGVILNIANRNPDYLKVVNGGMFAICDSSYVPLYIRWIYGKRYEQYCGSQIFMDIICSKEYRMIFMGTSQAVLNGLQNNLIKENPDVANMKFIELPYKKVEDFDYKNIAKEIEIDGANIIWVALGAPKQEYFMSKLKPYLRSGVMIAVGAAFKFFSGIEAKRAPEWMIKSHLEFVYRILREPKKQIKRCSLIVMTLPKLLIQEYIRKNRSKHQFSKYDYE